MASVSSQTLAAVFGCLLMQSAECRVGQATRGDIITSTGECPSGWGGPHRSMCYKLSDAKLSWTDANTAGCQNLISGAHLAAVTYSNKAYLSKQSQIFDSDYYWVGLRSGDTEWNKGTSAAEKLGFTHWEEINLPEPSGSNVTNDDCVLMVGNTAPDLYKPAGKWLDSPCNDKLPFLCELKQEKCPDYWTKVNGVCYMLHHQDHLGFYEAEAFCGELQTGATLAAVTDFDELAQSIPFDVQYFWIGLRSSPDSLFWTNGDEVSDTNWKLVVRQEPNGQKLDADDCVMVNGLSSYETFTVGEWGDYDCTYESRFLCAVVIAEW